MNTITSNKQIFLHIGTGKAGSSAIQSMLAKKRDKLKEANVLYPDMSIWRRRTLVSNDLVEKQSAWLALRDEIDLWDWEKIVISNEYFWSNSPYIENAKFAHRFLNDYPLLILVYLRNPVDYYISRFKQQIQIS